MSRERVEREQDRENVIGDAVTNCPDHKVDVTAEDFYAIVNK